MRKHNTVVIKMVGLTEEQIQKEFTIFFDDMVKKYAVANVGFGLSGIEPNSELDNKILSLVNL